jgi:GT2 family glycosyltransferase
MEPDRGGTRVAAVMAAYNRRDLTLACLRSLEAQEVPGVTLDAFVLDDASTDGTAAAVAREFPAVTVLHGDGRLYWNGGMRTAFGAAIEGDYDYYLWMNDDTALDGEALAVLLATERSLRRLGEPAPIVAGSTRHPETGELTYGGLVRTSRWRRLRFELVDPAAVPLPVETMNGNTALVPREVVRRIGNIDPAFVQQMGDYDYGLRARAAGCSVWLAPGTIGTCATNPAPAAGERPFLEEWRRIWSVKELRPGPWAVFSRRWAGRLWPVYWASPYLQGELRLARDRTRAHTIRPQRP